MIPKFHERTLSLHSFVTFNPREYYSLILLRNSIKEKLIDVIPSNKVLASGRVEKQKDYDFVSI